MRQEGRGIGLHNKIKAYNLQDGGMDTVEANEALGFPADRRDYGIGMQILVDLGLKNLRLLTNNPAKRAGLEGYGLRSGRARAAACAMPNEHNVRYLETKRTKMGHLLGSEGQRLRRPASRLRSHSSLTSTTVPPPHAPFRRLRQLERQDGTDVPLRSARMRRSMRWCSGRQRAREDAMPKGGLSFEGGLDASGLRIAVVVARFNAHVTGPLYDGCREELGRRTVWSWRRCASVEVPGCFELPLVAKELAASGAYDAVICLGAVIRGDTPHFDYVSSGTASGIQRAALDTGVPVMFGVLTTDNEEQALERIGGSGRAQGTRGGAYGDRDGPHDARAAARGRARGLKTAAGTGSSRARRRARRTAGREGGGNDGSKSGRSTTSRPDR